MSAASAAPFVTAFQARRPAEGDPRWLRQHRETALARFAERGYPTRRDEAWRFTDLQPLTAKPILPATDQARGAPILPADARLAGPSHRLVLVNGRYDTRLSAPGALPPGVWLGSTAAALEMRPNVARAALDDVASASDQAFAALGLAFFSDGFILALEPGIVLDTPVEIIHLGEAPTPRAFHLCNAVIAGEGSRASLIETFIGSGPCWSNVTTILDIGAGAVLRHAKVQDEAPEAVHLSRSFARLHRAARYEGVTLTTGARLSREDIRVTMAGEDARLSLNGAYLLRGQQEATIAPIVDHQAPGATTVERVTGVMTDRSHGIFLGTVMVRPGADRTDARQTNRNLLLDAGATATTKPELTILAEDVKCSHGATVGDLDAASLFYLLARGIDEPTARLMLIEAFAADGIDQADVGDALSAQLRRRLDLWLDRAERRE